MAATEDMKDLNITSEELDRLQKALKDEQFRKMFAEYAEEISNPENRKKYEEEIAELERNRGMDVKFINPEPGFVIKTSVDGEKKAFLNFCKNENIGKPQSKVRKQNDQPGYQWSIPHSLSPRREDLDKAGNNCVVFDCVFHPDCFLTAEKDPRFKKMIEDTAYDAIERVYKVKLDRNNLKPLKNMTYKGRASATVIRTPNSQRTTTQDDGVSTLELPYPYDNDHIDVNSNDLVTKSGRRDAQHNGSFGSGEKESSTHGPSGPTAPKYTITHRGLLDMQQFVNAPDSRPSTRPQELVIKIELPLLKSASGIQLDVFEKSIYLESSIPAAYKLDIPLPFPVDENHGSAKFDKSKSCMVVTLPVQPQEIPPLPNFAPIEDKPLLVEEIVNGSESEKGHQEKGYDSENSSVNPSVEKDVMQKSGLVNEVPKETDSSKGSELLLACDFQNSNITSFSEDAIPANAKDVPLPQKDGEFFNQNAKAMSVENGTSPLPNYGKFRFPEFSFHQREETVSIIVNVPGASPSSVKTNLSQDGQNCWIQLLSNDGRETAFGLHLVFPHGSGVSSVSFDVNSCNVVFLFHKKKGVAEWQSFHAGPNENNLQLKKFTTKCNIKESFRDLTLESRTHAGGSNNTELKSAKVVGKGEGGLAIELQFSSKGEEAEEGIVSGDVQVTDRDTDSELIVDICSSSLSETASSPSHDNSPLSPDSLLKSSIRTQRKRSSKSVSFSDEVVVGTFVSFQRRRGRKKSPHISKSMQKLKAPAQETCSDSELVLSYKGGDDSEEDLWNIPPRKHVHRQSSSESESDMLSPSRGKNKKSKGSRRRRKEKARKALIIGSSLEDCETGPNEEEEEDVFTYGPLNEADTVEVKGTKVTKKPDDAPPIQPSASNSSQVSSGDVDKCLEPNDKTVLDREVKDDMDELGAGEDGEWTTVTKKRHHKPDLEKTEEQEVTVEVEQDDEVNKQKVHSQEKEEEIVDLHKLDHHTESAVEFSNKVIFDLDD